MWFRHTLFWNWKEKDGGEHELSENDVGEKKEVCSQE